MGLGVGVGFCQKSIASDRSRGACPVASAYLVRVRVRVRVRLKVKVRLRVRAGG